MNITSFWRRRFFLLFLWLSVWMLSCLGHQVTSFSVKTELCPVILYFYIFCLWRCSCLLFQWLLAWMLSWLSGQSMTSLSVKTESCPVRSFASRRFSTSNKRQSRWTGWTVTWFWHGDESGCDKTCQQPCSLLHLYDVGSTHESAWSVAQSATQRHCPETLYFPLRCHSNSLCHPRCLCQETHLATDQLPPQSGFLLFCSK